MSSRSIHYALPKIIGYKNDIATNNNNTFVQEVNDKDSFFSGLFVSYKDKKFYDYGHRCFLQLKHKYFELGKSYYYYFLKRY